VSELTLCASTNARELLKRPSQTAARYRLYHTDDVTRLRLIQRARALGFSLEEIKELFALNDGVGRRKSVRAIAERRLHELQQRSRSLIECSERLLTSSANAMAMVH
jgi:DNA-binding transcriptional MerR regulator